jgi:hypothetical protein
MRRVLATDHGAGLYGRRKHMIEPVFGDIQSTAASTAPGGAANPPHRGMAAGHRHPRSPEALAAQHVAREIAGAVSARSSCAWWVPAQA